MEIRNILIRYYRTKHGDSPFIEWIETLDRATAARVDARLARVQAGNLGDHRPVGEGVHELRLQIGPGFRIYFAWEGTTLIILLGGGDKGSQRRDIGIAKRRYSDYKERANE